MGGDVQVDVVKDRTDQVGGDYARQGSWIIITLYIIYYIVYNYNSEIQVDFDAKNIYQRTLLRNMRRLLFLPL